MKECKHTKTAPLYDHVYCRDCGSIKTDSDRSWGIAANKWFESLTVAKFYKEKGFIPEHV
jgi:hypothetical protein